jgi:hypothetical protein
LRRFAPVRHPVIADHPDTAMAQVGRTRKGVRRQIVRCREIPPGCKNQRLAGRDLALEDLMIAFRCRRPDQICESMGESYL